MTNLYGMPVGLMTIEDAKNLIVWMEEHDAEIRKQTIEKCAEIISKEMYCVNCPNICSGFATNEKCAEIFKVYLTEEMKGGNSDECM